jgi:hypothetical protein
MKSLLTLLFLLSYIIGSAQASLVKEWDKRYGGTNREELTSFQQTTDGGYILGGSSYSDSSGDKTQHRHGSNNWCDYWVIKIDPSGVKRWDKRFGGTGTDALHSLKQTTDGGYILGGSSTSDSSGDKTQPQWLGGNWCDYWMVKTDSMGAKQWDKRFGGTSYDGLSAIQQTTDGGYILGGTSTSDSSGDKTQPSRGSTLQDYWIVKTDAFGNKQWDKRFGGSDDDVLYALEQTKDGGYILGGYSESGKNGDKTQSGWTGGWPDYWVVKIDSAGTKLWDKRYGGTDVDILYSLRQTLDGGYILGGVSNSIISGDKTEPVIGSSAAYDYWIIKIDWLGNKQWDKVFGGTQDEALLGNISQTNDGGYLLAGYSSSNSGGDKSENNLGTRQVWMVKTDSLGNKQWDKTIFTNTYNENGYAIQTEDKCYAIASYTNAGIGGYKTQSSQGDKDYWIVTFCDTTSSSISGIDNISEDDVVSVFPNPISIGNWQLMVGDNFIAGIVEVSDADGRVVFKSEIRNSKSEIAINAARGVYLLRISSAKSSVTRKLVRI